MAQVERGKVEDDNCVNVKPGALPQLPFLLPALLMPAPACLGSVVWCLDVTVSVLGVAARETVQREGSLQQRGGSEQMQREKSALLLCSSPGDGCGTYSIFLYLAGTS